MPNKFTHMSSLPVKLIDLGDNTYALAISLASSSITLSISTIDSVTNIESISTIDSVVTISNIEKLQQGTVTVIQDLHDNLNCNANLQVSNSDISISNPVPINTKEIIDSSMGIYGGAYITTTATTTPSEGYTFFAIQAVTDTIISSISGNIDVSSIALSEGLTIYGSWSSIELTSGSILAYQRIT